MNICPVVAACIMYHSRCIIRTGSALSNGTGSIRVRVMVAVRMAPYACSSLVVRAVCVPAQSTTIPPQTSCPVSPTAPALSSTVTPLTSASRSGGNVTNMMTAGTTLMNLRRVMTTSVDSQDSTRSE